jgi:flagellar biosynthesis protein FlhF
MKAKRYVGTTSRAVLQKVRLELGADAVILSNRACREGVEILAVSGDDMSKLIDDAPVAKRAEAAARPAAPAAPQAKAAAAAPPAAAPARKPDAPAAKKPTPAPEAAAAGSLLTEIKAMKGMLSEQIATLAWSDTMRRRPLRGVLLRELIAAGFAPALGRMLVDKLPDDFSEPQAREWTTAVLERNLRCSAGNDLIESGGVFALVGPTGVGKTTTAAKLAARCVAKHGAQHLGLITTDSYRIGAQDQLRAYGKILGVPVFVAQDAVDLRHAIDALAGKRLVLIDTVGMCQRNKQIVEQHDLLASAGVRRLLLLNASSQTETLDEVVRAYQGASGLEGAIITKLDEAARPGCALDVVIRTKLALRYVSAGQRVPEDLHLPNARVLVQRSLAAAARSATALERGEFGLLLDAGTDAGAAAHA